MSARRRLSRGASLSLLAGFVVWNIVFDRQVQQAGGQYVDLQRLHAEGVGPSMSMDAVMQPAVSRSAAQATAWGAIAAGTALVLARSAARVRLRIDGAS